MNQKDLLQLPTNRGIIMVTKKPLDVAKMVREEREKKLFPGTKIEEPKLAPQKPDRRVTMREGTPPGEEFGPRQVESLLSFVVEPDVERTLEDTERDNIVYAALGEHRILGKRKEKKGGVKNENR